MREGDPLEDLSADRTIILKSVFKEWGGWQGLDWCGRGKRQVAHLCECVNEPPGFVKCGEFFFLDEDLLAPPEGFCCT